MPLFRGQVKTLGARPIFWHFPAYLQSYAVIDEQRDPLFRTRPCSVVRRGRYKLHEYFEDGRIELYDLESDPGEAHDLAAEFPERAAALHTRLLAWRAELDAPVPTELEPRYTAPESSSDDDEG